MGRLLAVHTLANDNNVTRGTSTAKGLVVQTESTYHIGTAFLNNPLPQSRAVVKRS